MTSAAHVRYAPCARRPPLPDGAAVTDAAHVRYAPGTKYGRLWPRCYAVPEGIEFAREMVAAAANPFEAHSADECPHSDLDDLDEFGTPPLPIEAP